VVADGSRLPGQRRGGQQVMGTNPREGLLTRLRHRTRDTVLGDDPVNDGDAPWTSAASLYTCMVYREREFGWLLGPKQVEQFVTGLDPDDPLSLQAVLQAAVYRDQGPDADPAELLTYRLDVYDREGKRLLVDGYRFSTWLLDD
jgi:hypothetical protein